MHARLKRLDTAAAIAALHPSLPAPVRAAVSELVELQRELVAGQAALSDRVARLERAEVAQ